MNNTLRDILICPKCKNNYGLIADNWILGKDIYPGQTFFCAHCDSTGELGKDNTIMIIKDGSIVEFKRGNGKEPEEFIDADTMLNNVLGGY
jgi:hypothetical protein